MSCDCCHDALVKVNRTIWASARTRRYGTDLQHILWNHRGGSLRVVDGVVSLTANEEVVGYDEDTFAELSREPVIPAAEIIRTLYRIIRTGAVQVGIYLLTQSSLTGFVEVGGVERYQFAESWTVTHRAELDTPGWTPIDIGGSLDEVYIVWTNYDSFGHVGVRLLVSKHDAELQQLWTLELPDNPAPNDASGWIKARYGWLSANSSGVYLTSRQKLYRISADGELEWQQPLPGVPFTMTVSGDNLWIIWANFLVSGYDYQDDEQEPEVGEGQDVSHQFTLGRFNLAGELQASRLIPDAITDANAVNHVAAGSDGTLWVSSYFATPGSN